MNHTAHAADDKRRIEAAGSARAQHFLLRADAAVFGTSPRLGHAAKSRQAAASFSQVAEIPALRTPQKPFRRSDDFACKEAGKLIIFPAVIETNLFAVRHKTGLYYGSGQVDR